ncbi:hypothetical protein CW751_07385 [Brumimicrobium salinarum]|uniref:Uncharacterized protein n=2 Tax=Brumimicrobium salinarum TaxID=2058658 RepID=A0A2I0R3J7_9FLAO|nr:hypothetical protein CW751_07385 [Brumimicrobium salinarum]
MTRIVFYLFLSTLFIGCANYQPVETVQDKKEAFNQKIEDTCRSEYANQNYESLAYGQLTVYKPTAFKKLDSIYTIKKEYLDNNDLRGWQKSGIEEQIPSYRAAAQEEIDQVQYEIEHLFKTKKDESSFTIHHAFFLFDYEEKLINITPFYNYNLPNSYEEIYYDYQFEFHFITERDLYISTEESNFINFLKQREIDLIGDEALQPFMEHAMSLMKTAKKVGSVDFSRITQQLAIDQFKKINTAVTIHKLNDLYVVEDDGNVVAYELTIEWENDLGQEKSSKFTFSPYLELIDLETSLM